MVGAGEQLQSILIAGGITHPHIAARIVHAIGGTVEQYNEIVADKHRAGKLPKAQVIMVKERSWTRVCPVCKGEYVTYRTEQIYCCIGCATKRRHEKQKNKAAKEDK